VTAARVLTPPRDDLRYLKRFLDETAARSNRRIGQRLAELLTTLHAADPALFVPQEMADAVTRTFGLVLPAAGAVVRIFKRYRDRFPSFPEQANIALRHHCKEGDLKWVSLMLWAGADPYAQGTENYAEERDHGGGISALAFAALYRHFEVFKLKQIRLDPHHPGMHQLLCWLCKSEGLATQ
jgi:hypothetical protein